MPLFELREVSTKPDAGWRWLAPATLAVALASTIAPGQSTAAPPEVIDPQLATSLEPVVPLEQGWHDPPRMARVHCWWWWLNGNVDKQAITRDLQEMKAKGMGGANIIDAAHASQGEQLKPPHGPDFASPEWCELFLHALRVAERLDLELGFNIQSGWNLGGPTVTPKQAAKELTWSEQIVTGGRQVRTALREPESRSDFYRDIAVLALPLPDGGRRSLARVDNFRQKAYHEYPGGFTAVSADHLLDVGEIDPDDTCIALDEVVDLTESLDEEGRLDWDAPAGRWLVLRFGYTVDGAHVSTSSDNWKGLAIDYLDRAAFQQYCDDVLTPILEQAKPYLGKSLRFLHTDSWELGPVNWTPALPDEFATRRGYDLRDYLPVLAGYVVEDHVTSTRLLSDFRRTIAELIADGKYAAFASYAHERGLGIHPESGGPHAAPVDALLCLGRSDIPMGEFWARSRTHRVEDTSRLFVKQPASAAHIYGKRLVMAEAFTTIGPHWEKDPADLKPVFDRVACEGLNLVMWHTFDCSPAAMGIPGQAYFAGTHLNPLTTWWNQADGFLGYLNRCQFLLQQGLPVSDVLYFYGENVPSFVRLKRDNPARLPEGYDYDVTNLEVLTARARVDEGRVVLPDGNSYAIIALPPPGHYGLESLRQIARLADGGATVIGEKPSAAIGLFANAEEEAEFERLADRLWDDGLVRDISMRRALRDRKLRPDFSYSDIGGHRLDYIHRRTSDADIYFVANRRNKPCRTECGFRITDRQPELWDPVYGTMRPVERSFQASDEVGFDIDLPPNGSVFVVFRKPWSPGEQADYFDFADRQTDNIVREISGPWIVHFDPKWGGPATTNFDTLIDWSTSDDDRIRYYSGTASYERHFVHSTVLAEQEQLWLDLGEVKNMARVYLNKVDLGVAWTPPYRVNLTPVLRKGTNQLRIEVVNLWPNRLIGDATLPPDQRLTKTNISKFKGDEPLLPSGLLGPVRLVTEAKPASTIVTDARPIQRSKQEPIAQ